MQLRTAFTQSTKQIKIPGLGNPCGYSLRFRRPSPNSYDKSQGCSVDNTSLASLTVKYKGGKKLKIPARRDLPERQTSLHYVIVPEKLAAWFNLLYMLLFFPLPLHKLRGSGNPTQQRTHAQSLGGDPKSCLDLAGVLPIYIYIFLKGHTWNQENPGDTKREGKENKNLHTSRILSVGCIISA